MPSQGEAPSAIGPEADGRVRVPEGILVGLDEQLRHRRAIHHRAATCVGAWLRSTKKCSKVAPELGNSLAILLAELPGARDEGRDGTLLPKRALK